MVTTFVSLLLANIEKLKPEFPREHLHVTKRKQAPFDTSGCAFFPIQLGDCCLVGEGTVVHAATVGNFIRFGKNCYIG